MDMSAAEVKRAASAQPQTPPHADPNGSEILVRCLQAENVKFLWGYPGGAVLYIYDALYKQDTMQHVLVRHEQAAIHAAASRQMQTVCRAYNAGLRATAKQSDAIERRLSILTARLGNA